MASLARVRANWLLFVKLLLNKRNNASILPQVIWMQPGRHTWAPWSLAIYRLWCMVQLFLCFLSVCFLYCVFSWIELLSKKKKKKRKFNLSNGKCFQILDSWLRNLQPSPHSPPFTTRGCQMFEACDLLSFIVWYTCTHVFNVKRYCIVSKCFANTLAERWKEDSVISCTAFASAKNEKNKKNHVVSW